MPKTLRATQTGCIIVNGNAATAVALFTNPMLDPANVLFHSDFNYYGVVAKNLSVTINHAAIPGYTAMLNSTIIQGQKVETSYALLYHGLGYIPKYFVSYNGYMLPQGVPIQIDGVKVRYVTAWADASYIYIYDAGFSSDTALAAISLLYKVVVFRNSSAVPGMPMLELNATADRYTFGQGKFQISQEHMRLAALGGDTPFALALGKTTDINHGGVRVVPPGGSALTYGPYGGSFSGSAFQSMTI